VSQQNSPKRDEGMTIIELMIVAAVMAVIAAAALPSAMNSLRSYRLNSDTSGMAGTLNLARMRSASQYAPYRVNIFTSSGTYNIEKLCGNTPSSTDSACTSPYKAFTTAKTEYGTQYLNQGSTAAACHPSTVTAYPGIITADAAGCPGAGPDPLRLYFNTRGSPVDSNGNPLTSGGAVLYLSNQSNLTTAVTVAVGGRVAVWTWSSQSSKWSMR
jgi:prepilin-type N-terminal cleavage/methylation domain-containing protein